MEARIEVQALSREAAACALARAGVRDPAGINSAADIASGGDACVRLDSSRGSCVLVLRVRDGVLWIDGAASADGAGLSPGIGLLAEETARRAGCARVRFETQRPGLLRLALRRGWRVCGVLPVRSRPAYIIEKEI